MESWIWAIFAIGMLVLFIHYRNVRLKRVEKEVDEEMRRSIAPELLDPELRDDVGEMTTEEYYDASKSDKVLFHDDVILEKVVKHTTKRKYAHSQPQVTFIDVVSGKRLYETSFYILSKAKWQLWCDKIRDPVTSILTKEIWPTLTARSPVHGSGLCYQTGLNIRHLEPNVRTLRQFTKHFLEVFESVHPTAIDLLTDEYVEAAIEFAELHVAILNHRKEATARPAFCEGMVIHEIKTTYGFYHFQQTDSHKVDSILTKDQMISLMSEVAQQVPDISVDTGPRGKKLAWSGNYLSNQTVQEWKLTMYKN